MPGLRTIRRDTSPPSASWGIHFGFTKLVISMARSPVCESASTRRILSSVGTMRDSFCRPSRGPTSYSITSGGNCSNTLRSYHARPARPVRAFKEMGQPDVQSNRKGTMKTHRLSFVVAMLGLLPAVRSWAQPYYAAPPAASPPPAEEVVSRHVGVGYKIGNGLGFVGADLLIEPIEHLTFDLQ